MVTWTKVAILEILSSGRMVVALNGLGATVFVLKLGWPTLAASLAIGINTAGYIYWLEGGEVGK